MNRRVYIRLSDPWDLGKALGWRQLEGSIVNIKFDDGLPVSVLVKLSESFNYKDTDCEYFIVSKRLKDGDFGAFAHGSALFSAMTRIPSSQVSADDPFDLSYWRGGVAIIGEIELTKSENGE